MNNFKIPTNIAISESGFIFLPSTGETFTVNILGSEIINLLKENKGYEDILSFLLEEYDVEEKTLTKDLNDYLGQLKNLNILKEL